MVKVTLEQTECDVCRRPGERYTVAYPDGMKVLDRCETHARKLKALRDEPGEWTSIAPASGKRGLTVLSPTEIAARRTK